ncbi:MAG: hypothetical protein ACJAZB_001476 [Psychrosphaera sp.]|jgi:hypothetical protein
MTNNQWWGDFTFDDQQIKRWQIGERAITIKRAVNEWNCWNFETSDEIDLPIELVDIEQSTDNSEKMFGRYLENNSEGKIRISPQLADRSVVTRPATPLTLLTGEKTQLFISTPIWFSAKTLSNNQQFIDLPFWRPSDSWFGASTIDGQLCYAKYTSARIQLAHLEKRSHRAITPITVINHQDKPLVIERLNVPVNLLNLYCDDHNQFWTSGITVKTENHSRNVEMHINEKVPKEVQSYELVTPPRIVSETNKLIRNISNLLG